MIKVLTAKDVANQCDVSLNTAKNYIKDIKSLYDIKAPKITQYHLNDYFGIKSA